MIDRMVRHPQRSNRLGDELNGAHLSHISLKSLFLKKFYRYLVSQQTGELLLTSIPMHIEFIRRRKRDPT